MQLIIALLLLYLLGTNISKTKYFYNRSNVIMTTTGTV